MKGGQPISLSVRLSYLAIAHTMTPKYMPHVRTGLRISPLKAQSGNFTSDEAVHWHSHLSHKGRGGKRIDGQPIRYVFQACDCAGVAVVHDMYVSV